MQYKRIIVGDQEIKVPSLSLGALPIAGLALLIWLLSGVYIVGPDEVGALRIVAASFAMLPFAFKRFCGTEGIDNIITASDFVSGQFGKDYNLEMKSGALANLHSRVVIVLDESGYSSMLKNKKDVDNENRLENIKELLSAMKEFDNLESFLEHVSLATSIDQEWDGEKVNMMTMHAAKGLEFDVVFLPGWEEGLFPHQKSIEEKGQNGLEEERRLAYVGITRAKKKAIISFSMNRFYQGDWIDSMASRFIEELPEKHLEKNSFFDEEKEEVEDFEFNQDFELEEGTRSPGWIRYQKRIK